MKMKSLKAFGLAVGLVIGGATLVVTPASADIVNPYGAGFGFVKCPGGGTRPYIYTDPGPPNSQNYGALTSLNNSRAATALLACGTPGPGEPGYDPAVTGPRGGPISTEGAAQIDGIRNQDSLVASDTPTSPNAAIATLLCCERPGQQTSLVLNTGTASWTVRLPNATADVPVANAVNVAWTTSVLPASSWISPTGNPTATGTYIYTTRFDTGDCRARCVITLNGRFLVDNRGVLKVNGVTVATSGGTPMYGFLPGSLTPVSYNIPVVTGIQIITFEAFNQSGPTGANIELTVRRCCIGRPGGPDSQGGSGNPRALPATKSPVL